ncbi:MAG: hypothetical protein QOG53_2456 [Frankiales bacterium]|jgi:hypothetical protein|nr:hypothetical protein [Frankiales bacterium]
MTAPALTWRVYDARLSGDDGPAACSYPDCTGTALLMRGPRDHRLQTHLRWRVFCRSHASMYGATLRGSRLVTAARFG